MPQCAQWACIKKRHNTNTLWASNNQNETFLSGQKEAAETTTTTTTTTRFHCKHRVQVDGRKEKKKNNFQLMAIYETRARSTHYTRTRSWHPRQRRGTSSPTSDATLRPVRARESKALFSRSPMFSAEEKKSRPRSFVSDNFKKKKETLGPALLSSFSCGYTPAWLYLVISTLLPIQNRRICPKEIGKWQKK